MPANTIAKRSARGGLSTILCASLLLLAPVPAALGDGQGTFQFTKRFDGASVVKEVEWFYDRSVPSLTFGETRVIWTGVGAPGGTAGSDGLFHTPAGDLIVANWEGGAFFKLDPEQTDDVIEGPEPAVFAFHTLLHPNLDDFLDTPALGNGVACNSQSGPVGCFAVHDHTPLTQGTICLAPPDSASDDALQPVTFIADENLNMFVVFREDDDIQFGGGGFASFDLAGTDSGFCDPGMTMTRLIPTGIDSAHSISWSPFLSDANAAAAQASLDSHSQAAQGPHSDFIVFANYRMGHIRVMNPGAANASAEVLSEVDFTSEPACTMLLPPDGQGEREFDQGAVTGSGIALVADESTGYVALLDYSQNQNGTIRDPENMVCLVAHLEDGIDDIAPLTGLGAKEFFGPGDDGPMELNAGHSGAFYEARTAGQGFFVEVTQDDLAARARGVSRTEQAAANSGFVFVSWFTYTTGDSAHPFQQQWYTLQGPYSGDRAFLDINESLGGEFDDSDPVDTNKVGSASLVMFDCDTGEITYNFDDGRKGVIPFARVIPGSGNSCEELAEAAPQSVDINAGMDGAWFNSETPGQGFFLDANPSSASSGTTRPEALGTGFLFLSWFTYGDDTASGQHWYTAQGSYDGEHATIDINETTGGSFDDTQPVSTVKVGTMDIEFIDCANAELSYSFTGGPQGEMDLIRVVPNSDALCDALTSAP